MVYIGHKVTEVKTTNKFTGHQFIIDGKNMRVGVKRCRYCGKEFQWAGIESDICSNSACQDFLQRRLKFLYKEESNLKHMYDNPNIVREILQKSHDLKRMGISI